MSNAKPKPVAEINLEEFERRLRASAAPQAGIEDPLAELTRLVDSIGYERTPAERALDVSRASRPAPTRAEGKPELRLAPAPEPARPAPPPPPAPLPAPASPPALKAPAPPPEAAPSWEAAPPLGEGEPALRPSFQAEDLDSFAFDPPTSSESEPVEAAAPAPRAGEPPRARHWGLKVGGLIAASVVMIAAVVVFKVGGASHTGAPPLILASTAPTKVAPPNEETIRTANESGSLLTRDTAQPTPTPPKLVDPPEAPVDLSARPQPAASPSPAPVPSASADASPVAPSSDTPIVATVAPSAVPISPVGADPSRVKTISVRPDGTLISSGYEAAPAPSGTTPLPAAPEKPALAAADGEASSPAVALPTKLAPPKAATRVVNKTDTTAPADTAGPGPAPVKPKKAKPAPAPVAEAEPTTDDAAAAAPAAPSGGFAVQLAAPRSESEAKALIRALPGRYSEALSGASLGVRKADRNGETIYRVRALGLSRAEANAMCSKVKAAGGDCYVAKN